MMNLLQVPPQVTVRETTPPEHETNSNPNKPTDLAVLPRPYTHPERYKLDPHAVQRIAVWCGDRLFIYSHVDPREHRVRPWGEWPAYRISDEDDVDLADVARIALRTQCAAVWLVPERGTAPGKRDPAFLRGWSVLTKLAIARSSERIHWHELSAHRGTSLAGLVAQAIGDDGKPHGMPCMLYATWAGAWPVLSALEDEGGCECPEQRAQHVAEGVMLAAFTLRAQLRYSPSHVGFQVLRDTLAPKLYDIPPLSSEFRALLAPIMPAPLMWHRRLFAPRQTWPIANSTPHGPRRGGARLDIEKYDRISSYVASAREVPVGDPRLARGYEPGLCGVYHLAARAPDDWPARMPGLFHVGEGEGEYPHVVASTWAWEPQLRSAISSGWQVTIQSGYVWPDAQKHDLLRLWQQRIWRAINECAAHAGVAGIMGKRICKLIGVATVGRLGQGKGHIMVPLAEARSRGLEVQCYDISPEGRLTGYVEVLADLNNSPDLMQPHWRATIVANANERLIHAMYVYAPHDTAIAYVDAFYCLKRHPSLEQPGMSVLGKFRHEHTYRVRLAELADLEAQGTAQAMIKWLVVHERDGEEGETEAEVAAWS